jgi:hypothetical protein
MKLVKSLLLGSAAGFAVVAGAQAADLPTRKAVAVDYVKTCTTYGVGYWNIPGTDMCLRISGYLQADYLYLEPSRRDFDATGFRGRGRLNFDIRNDTEYGLLRAFIRGEFRRNTGTFVSGGQTGIALSSSGSATSFGTAPTDTALLHLGYLQFGGLSAGRVQSFYDFWANDGIATTLLGVSDTKTQAIAYTFSNLFGMTGWSATIAMEDPQERRFLVNPNLVFGNTLPVGFSNPAGFGTVAGATLPLALGPAGTRAPDGVANLRVDQAWGAAQLSAAVHDIEAANLFRPVGVPTSRPFQEAEGEAGWAVQGGVQFKLPMIAAGDSLWLQAAYADGALAYTHSGLGTQFRSFGSIRLADAEAIIDPLTGNIKKTESWSVSGNFLHYWTPSLRSNIFGAYSEIDYARGASVFAFAPATGQVVNFGFADKRISEAGANLIWSPVKNLDIGVEAIYRNVDFKGRVPVTVAPLAPGAALDPRFNNVKSQDFWEARLRIERDF